MDSLLGGSRFSRSVGRTLRVLIKETHQTSILEIRCKSTRFFVLSKAQIVTYL